MISGASAARCVIAGLALLALTQARAESLSLEQLLQSLAQVKTARASFVEKKFLAIVDRPVESSGKLLYVAPDRLEKHTLQPRRESMILERDQIVIEIPGKNASRTLRLDEYPVLRAFVESIRATLAGDAAALHRYYASKLIGSTERWTLILAPKDKDTQKLVRAIHIAGVAVRINKVEVQQNDGDRSVMLLSEEP